METPLVNLTHHIFTYSGKLCSIEDPPSIEDIVVSLGRLARFSGNTLYDFNVMAHSIHVGYILYKLGYYELVLQGLVHDATECMFGDIPTPFKNAATKYLEEYVGSKIFEAHGYNFKTISPIVHQADRISLIMEAKELLVGDSWKTILSSIELEPEKVNGVDNYLLTNLIWICEDNKKAFRPGGLIYTSVLEVINSIKTGDDPFEASTKFYEEIQGYKGYCI